MLEYIERESVVYALIAFIKMHEREDIPDDVWEICMRLYDFTEDAL